MVVFGRYANDPITFIYRSQKFCYVIWLIKIQIFGIKGEGIQRGNITVVVFQIILDVTGDE